MPGLVGHRTVTPFIQLIQEIGRGRKVVYAIRFTDEQVKRTQPPPHVPYGPNHKTSEVYYYTRDARREVQPPIMVDASKQIGTEIKSSTEEYKHFTPGKVYDEDA